MQPKKTNRKIISLLICTLFLASIFPGIATARNPVYTDIGTASFPIDVRCNPDVIKITDLYPMCDMNDDFVVYAEDYTLYIYDIHTAETDDVYMGTDIIYPKISDHKVVYYDFSYMGFKMYDIDTSENTELIVTNWEGGESDAFQFNGEYIVYENCDLGLESTEIFLYNLSSHVTIQLTDTPGEDYTEKPCIYENIVAWQLAEGNLFDIFIYNIESQDYTRVTNTSQFASETFPSIYGDDLVYSYFYYDKVNGTMFYALKMYTISTAEEITIFTGEEPTGSTPEIFGNIIAYSDPGVSLRLYDVITHENTTIYEGEKLAYPWNLNANYIVFTVIEDGVYLYEYTENPHPVIQIENISGGLFQVNAILKNAGDVAATNVEWSITLTGGLIIIGKETTGILPTLEAGATADISSKFIFGFGKTIITVTAGAATQSQNATVLFVFIKI